MRKRLLGLLLGLLVLAIAPGCRVLAGAAVILGEAAIEAALDGDDDDRDCEAPRRRERAEPRRAPEAPRDPCR